jgi:hypothetical protein
MVDRDGNPRSDTSEPASLEVHAVSQVSNESNTVAGRAEEGQILLDGNRPSAVEPATISDMVNHIGAWISAEKEKDAIAKM